MAGIGYDPPAGSSVSLPIAESDVTNLVSDLAAKTTPAAALAAAKAVSLDQFAVPAADLSANSHKITNLTNGSGAQDAAAFGQLVSRRAGASLMRTGALAETYSRSGRGYNGALAALTTQVITFQAIELFAGQVIGHITFLSGTTALSAGTNQWFCITDASRVQVATTTDDTSTAWGTSAEKTLAIATIASGASSTYTAPSDGLYYLGCMVKATTVPTLFGVNANATAPIALAPIISGTSDGSLTTPPAFPKTYGALTAATSQVYAYVSA